MSAFGTFLGAIPNTSNWFHIAAAIVSAAGLAGLGQQAASVPGMKQELEERTKLNDTKFIKRVDIK